MRNLRVLAAAAALVALGCSGDDGPTQPGTGANTVQVGTPDGGLSFSPPSVTVALNSTVTWNWNSGGVVHNVTFQDASTSGNKASGSFQKTFPTAGTFSYLCTIHGAVMSGTVTVNGSAGQNGGSNGGGNGGGGAYP
jgi:plastocyanin